MIIVDTCVWSEPMRRSPAPQVLAWLHDHRAEVGLTTITAGELLAGVALMPVGRRRDHLAQLVEDLIQQARARTLPYDEAAARAFADIVATRRANGRRISRPNDAMIAAIARAHGCAVATRNVSDFESMGVELINPWDAPAR